MVLAICAVFKVRREAPERSHCDRAGLSKLNSMRALRPLPDSVDISGRRLEQKPSRRTLADRVSRLSETRAWVSLERR